MYIGFCVSNMLLPMQMKTLMLTIESYDRHVVNQKYLKYKPGDVSVREDQGALWRYAITAVLEEDIKRKTEMWSWQHIKKHRTGECAGLVARH